MKSYTNEKFRKAFRHLPPHLRKQARQAYLLFKENPYHPSLNFKQVHPNKPIYSARISLHYRVLGIRHDDTIVWFWIGTHDEYDRLISQI